MARELVRVMFDSFEAVLLSWRGRKLLSRQLSALLMLLACSFSIVKPGAKVITIEPSEGSSVMLWCVRFLSPRVPSRKGYGFRFN